MVRFIVAWAALAPAWAQSLTLKWDPSPSADVSGYNLYRSTHSGSGYVRVNQTPVPSTSFTDSTLRYDTTYYYVCTAVNHAGLESGYSNEVQAAISQFTPPTGSPTGGSDGVGSASPPSGSGNSAPVARDDSLVLENRYAYRFDVRKNDLDADGDELEVYSVTQPAHGVASITRGGWLTYRLRDDTYKGLDEFRYRVSDGRGGRATAKVRVQSLGRTSSQAAGNSISLDEDTSRRITTLPDNVRPEGGTVTTTLIQAPKSGSVQVGERTITYLPDPDYSGPDSFSYAVSDEFGEIVAATISVHVLPVNDPPVPGADTAITDPETKLDLAVLLNDSDTDGDSLRITRVEQPLHGHVTIAEKLEEGTLIYEPDADFTGFDRFYYWVGDGVADAPALVTVQVAAQPMRTALRYPASIDGVGAPFGDTYVGLALLNGGEVFEAMRIRGFEGDGQEVLSSTRSETLAPLGQQALLTRDLNDPRGQARYVEAESVSGDLKGMIVVGDYNRRRMDGMTADEASGRQLYVPEVMMSSESQTFLQLINHEGSPGRIELELYDGHSRRPVRWSGTIAGAGSVEGLISDFFGYADGFEGYVRVVSEVEVSGLAVSAGQEWISTVPTMVARHGRSWSTPHVFADTKGGDTVVRIVNTGLLDAFGEVTLYGEAGQELSTRRVFLAGEEATVLRASELFGDLGGADGTLSGSLVVKLEGETPPAVLALVTYETAKARTTLTLVSEGQVEATFPQVAQSRSERIFTGVAVFNPTTAAAEVTLEIYDREGRKTAETGFRLEPKGREAKLLGDPSLLGADFEQLGGHLRIRSDRPVVSCLTFGDDDGETLSAIAP